MIIIRPSIRFSLASFIFLMFAAGTLFSQGRLIINNNAFVVIDNSAFVVVANPATNAITTTGTGGNIVTESEFDRVKWNIGTSTGTYVMPFTSSGGIKIPFTVTINTAGAGAGNIMFSTYPGPTWDNNTYRPSDVTHMFDYYTGSFNNSPNVIDRFWIIDANGYTTRPSATLGFTYIDAEHLQVGNTIIEADLRAQRFNNSLNIWGDYFPVGAINTAANTVTAVPAVPADFFRSWTLSELTSPLSIELTSLKASCENNTVEVLWSTASETSTEKFIIEASGDGVTFYPVAEINAAGNAVVPQNYSLSFHQAGYTVVRLVLINQDGTRSYFGPLAFTCTTDNDMWAYVEQGSGNFVVQSLQEIDPNWKFYLTDVSGRIIYASPSSGATGDKYRSFNTTALSNGLYLLVAHNGKEDREFKLVLTR